jgi:coenzyme F420-dependent glucose-6-phosphate dehydrogenase
MKKIYWFLGHEQFQPEVLVKHAQVAEAAGFDGVMVSEHFHPWVEAGSGSGFAFATLGAIAQATERLGLMTAVTTPLFRYHPAVVAQAAATIDRLSNGRFGLGVGTGEHLNEGPLGYDFPGYKERSARMREALEIMRRLLDGEKLDFAGEFYSTRAAKLYSPPLHRVPIWLAAGGAKSAALAGELADGLMVSAKDTAATAEVIAAARSAAGERSAARGRLEATGEPAAGAGARPGAATGRVGSTVGARLSVAANHWAVVAADDEAAWRALGPWRGLRAPSRGTAADPAQLQAEADGLPRAKVLAQYSVVRSVAELVPVYAPLVTELGADIVGIQATALDQEALIEAVGAEVVPALRRLSPQEPSGTA